MFGRRSVGAADVTGVWTAQFGRTVGRVRARPITTELRTKEVFTNLLVFTILVALIFAFAFVM